jgi:hypothetical protein
MTKEELAKQSLELMLSGRNQEVIALKDDKTLGQFL